MPYVIGNGKIKEVLPRENIIKSFVMVKGLKADLQIEGNNNKIVISKNALLLNSLVNILGDNCVVSIG